MGKKKSFVSNFHEPFAEVRGTVFNYLCQDPRFGQSFMIKRGNFEYELVVSNSGRKVKIHRHK